MGKELKEILKKGSKAKLIQLAIDTPEFSAEGVGHMRLTEEEIETIKQKARDGKWEGELYRAIDKARDIEAMVLAVKGETYEALFYLQEFLKVCQRTEIFLDTLMGMYIGDWDEEKDEWRRIIEKDEEEVKSDVEGVYRDVFNFSLTEQLVGMKGKFQNEEESKNWRWERNGFDVYKKKIKSAKEGTFFVVSSKFAGYRLYKKDQLEEIELALGLINQFSLVDLTNCLGHIDYLKETIEKNTPSLWQEIQKREKIYIPDKKTIEGMEEHIDKHLLLPIEIKKGKGRDWDKIFETDYLLSELSKKEVEEIEEKQPKLEEYVRYGR